MSWDIYGVPLRRGQCKVHPYVHEGYPCSVCIADERLSDQQGGYEHLLSLAQEHIKELEHQRDALAVHVERMSKAALNAIHYLPGGDIKAELRDAYDETPETSLTRLKAEWDKAELQPVWETLIKVADLLGIDAGEARSLPGKPSDVYAAYLARLKAQWQAEVLGSVEIMLYDSLRYTDEQRDLSRRITDILRRKAYSLERQAEGDE